MTQNQMGTPTPASGFELPRVSLSLASAICPWRCHFSMTYWFMPHRCSLPFPCCCEEPLLTSQNTCQPHIPSIPRLLLSFTYFVLEILPALELKANCIRPAPFPIRARCRDDLAGRSQVVRSIAAGQSCPSWLDHRPTTNPLRRAVSLPIRFRGKPLLHAVRAVSLASPNSQDHAKGARNSVQLGTPL